MGRLSSLGSAVTLAFIILGGAAAGAAGQGMLMRDQLLQWARSTQPADHIRLRQALTDRATLQALDRDVPVPRRGGPRAPTPYDDILGAFAVNPALSARDAFAQLASDRKFAGAAAGSPLDPLASMVRASALIAEPDPRIIAVWRKLSTPGGGYVPVVIDTLIANGSPQAIDLLVTLAASKSYPTDEKVAWMRDSLTPNRTAEPALVAAERLLQSAAIPTQVKTAVVEALFARDTSKWYTPGTWPGAPPDPATASSDARQARERIARAVLAGGLTLPGALRADVQAAVGRP